MIWPDALRSSPCAFCRVASEEGAKCGKRQTRHAVINSARPLFAERPALQAGVSTPPRP
jgi:hypothetical protein